MLIKAISLKVACCSFKLENPLDWFEIDEISGYISTKSALDREHVSVDQHTSQYLLKVIANDDGEISKAFSHVMYQLNDC